MDRTSGVRALSPKVQTALEALRSVRGEGLNWTKRPLDEAGRTAYAAVVRAELLKAFGVPAPVEIDRLIAEAAVMAVTPERCVQAIGDAFRLQRLPERRY